MMKKSMAILIGVLMVFMLSACHNGAAPSPSAAASPDTGASAAPASTEPTPRAVDVGFFDPAIDYSTMPRYKMAYVYTGTSILYDRFTTAFGQWAEQMNVAFEAFSAADTDQFLDTIRSYAGKGYDGLLLDPDPAAYPAVAALMEELNLLWMSCLSAPLDENGKLLHPAVAIDSYGAGYDMFRWCIDYAKATWPDATPENTGGLFIGYTGAPRVELNRQGSYDAWTKSGYTEETFFFGDGESGDMTDQTGYNLASKAFEANPQIEYWVACGFFDDYSQGIARAAEAAGKGDRVICAAIGGTALIDQWDDGLSGPFKSAVFIDQRLYAEPLFCGLYAMITDQATAETLWPRWVDATGSAKYANLLLPYTILTRDMYKDYLTFVDNYTGVVLYDKYGINSPRAYPVLLDPTAAYAG